MAELDCHPQTVREWLAGLGDRPAAGRKRRLTETEQSRIIALVATAPPGRVTRDSEDMLTTFGSAGRAGGADIRLERAGAAMPVDRTV